MSDELEMIGVDVWAAVTIYVPAKDDEEAAAIVAERYAGSRDKIGSYDHMGSEDLPMEDDDFMSSAMTFYGLCNDSELLATVDPVRDAAPVMLDALKLCRVEMEMLRRQYEAEGKGEEWVTRQAYLIGVCDAAIAKAEGRV